jgi:hypothetical protein
MPNFPKTSGWPERIWRNAYASDVARGIVPGSEPYSVFGERLLANASKDVVITENGMPTTLIVPQSIQLSVVSSSASDTGLVAIRYLDGGLVSRNERLQLNGTTPVLTQATDIRAVNNVYYVDGAGVVGNVSGTNGGVTYFRLNIGDIQFNTSMQRVPARKRLMINGLYGGSVSGSSASRIVLKLQTSFINGDSFANLGLLHPVAAIALQDSSATLGGFGPFPIPAGEWVGFTASCDKAADVVAGLFGWIEDE